MNEFIRGYESAVRIIIKERQNKKVIQHHRNVATGDLAQDNFTKGWIKACEDYLESKTDSES